MKIVINSNYISAGTRVCIDEMIPLLREAGHTVGHNDWQHYDQYDAALFMAPDSQVEIAKKQNPAIVTIIMDPKFSSNKKKREVKLADGLVVSSIEQRDSFLSIHKNVCIYYMFPDILHKKRLHTKKNNIVIGYHGNKVHLESFSLHINEALETLSHKYPIELHAIYNISLLGKWKKNLPRIPVKHIQWHENVYDEALPQIDVGIVNNYLPINTYISNIVTSVGKKFFFYNPFNFSTHDYLVRYKYSTNPGRVYVFSQLGVPVVADAAPSMSQFIQDGYSGFLANSAAAWYHALEKLIIDENLRNTCSQNLSEHIEKHFSREKNFNSFNLFLQKIYATKNKKYI